jgi:hypothetical protein
MSLVGDADVADVLAISRSLVYELVDPGIVERGVRLGG